LIFSSNRVRNLATMSEPATSFPARITSSQSRRTAAMLIDDARASMAAVHVLTAAGSPAAARWITSRPEIGLPPISV
jgi:hypothetical protein